MTSWFDKAKTTLPGEATEIISKFLARKRMQDKYITQVRQGEGQRMLPGKDLGF
jgi:hypothetical protein